ncbi:phosphorylase family protein [Bradyrhizobium diazoefficiens]|uniref:phosphorylase family protein n=1 Tax=Bradyrhizobium diazoefficiens TaxID=1355477 RepID=UPI0027151E01|nr:hypothetical protein [Bradyrhizobium diazoefficiens]WLB38385.1 hypothetical protein QIH78_00610 [Bradyrhizobium diazoefficiens]
MTEDYFSNIEDANAQQRAAKNFTYNELVLRAPPISIGSTLSRVVDIADSILGQTFVDRMIRWFAGPILQRGTALRDIPSSYAIVHNDLFDASMLSRKRKLAAGHYVGEFEGFRLGLMACRRGALEALIQADALGRMGVRKIFFMGTCLRIAPRADLPAVIVPSTYSSEWGSEEPLLPAAATSARLSTQLLADLGEHGILAKSGPVYIAHKFLLEETPRLLLALAEARISAVEMEGLGFISGLAKYDGEFAAALIGLDQFWPGDDNHFLNVELTSYVDAGRTSKRVLRAGLSSLAKASL